jgi:SagB-type dehydrogenase family enzyme
MTREFLKDSGRKTFDFSRTDQNKGIAMPPIQKLVPKGAKTIALPDPRKGMPSIGLKKAIAGRRSRRTFSDESISLNELSFLLWATQGVRDATNPARIYRNVPSAGNRHALETYIAAFRVEGLPKAIYRYLPEGHKLVLEAKVAGLGKKVSDGCFGQRFAGESAATFIWTTIPYRMEWRYGETSYKVIALDAGHACQNLYLACEAIGCGTCAIAAYDQEAMDELLGVDGEDEFTLYIAPVGKVER